MTFGEKEKNHELNTSDMFQLSVYMYIHIFPFCCVSLGIWEETFTQHPFPFKFSLKQIPNDLMVVTKKCSCHTSNEYNVHSVLDWCTEIALSMLKNITCYELKTFKWTLLSFILSIRTTNFNPFSQNSLHEILFCSSQSNERLQTYEILNSLRSHSGPWHEGNCWHLGYLHSQDREGK